MDILVIGYCNLFINFANNSGKPKIQRLQEKGIRIVVCSDRITSMTLEHARLGLDILDSKRDCQILLLAHNRAANPKLRQMPVRATRSSSELNLTINTLPNTLEVVKAAPLYLTEQVLYQKECLAGSCKRDEVQGNMFKVAMKTHLTLVRMGRWLALPTLSFTHN